MQIIPKKCKTYFYYFPNCKKGLWSGVEGLVEVSRASLLDLATPSTACKTKKFLRNMLNFQKIILTKTNPATRGEELFPVLKILRLPSIIFIQHYSVQFACFFSKTIATEKLMPHPIKGKKKWLMADEQ